MTRRRTRSSQRKGRLWLAALLLLLAAVGGWSWRQFSAEADTPSYLTAAVKREDLEQSVSALGNLQPRDYVDVGAQVSGQLKVLNVNVGDRVKAGDLLAEIDPVVFQARVDAGKAQLASLAAQKQERQARLALAELQLTRQRNLRKANATSDDLLEQADAEVRINQAQIASLQAQIDQIQSTLKADQANLGYARIYAPMSGTVVSITARRGQTLNANQSAPIILRIADLAVMTVWTQVSEADVSKLVLGQEAYFTTLGSPDRRYVGTLKQVMPTPDVVNNVVLYNALFDVPNSRASLMTQMTAQVFFVVAKAQDVLTVPASALLDDRGGRGTAVLVRRPDGSVERQRISIGVATRTRVEVREGLVEGDVVVIGAGGGETAQGGERRPGGPPAPRARLG